jgi:site-specific DNA-cytosine methylase
MILAPRTVEIRHFHLFCGLGGGKKGFNRGRAHVGHLRAKFRCVGGIDNDKAAIADFDRLGGGKGTVLDLFSREQYTAFHGHPPPDGWREATPADIRAAAGGEIPHIGFGSAPCKGFSGLLSESRSGSSKYQALNQLALRGLWLALEAWKDNPLEFWLWENVPRIQTRGRAVLDQMIALLRAYGYAVVETTHDCGELGGLGQSRKRFLLVARHVAKVPPFLYQPPKRPLRSVGEIIGRLPVPGPDLILPMHRLPRLQWQTWLRLALVEAGSDWRSLNKYRVADGVLQDFRLMPDGDWNGGVLGVKAWDETSGTVTGRGAPTCGAFSVADPRIDGHERSVQLGVRSWEKPTGVVKGDMSVGCGPYAVADPRYGAGGLGDHYGKMRVQGWDGPGHTVTGSDRVGSGALSIADPRPYDDSEWANGRRGLGVLPWNRPAGTVTSSGGPNQGNYSIADPRFTGGPRFNHVYRIVPWDAAAPAVTSANGGTGAAVADPRAASGWMGKGKYVVAPFDGPANTVISGSTTGNGAFAVADPRPMNTRNGKEVYKTSGEYGVVAWDGTSGGVTAAAGHDNGRWSVADPREHAGTSIASLPAATERLVAVIRALDGTCHRPFTTLELAALQSLADPDEILELTGVSDSAHRERIGNAVPPAAAEAIASVMGHTLLLAWSGKTSMLSASPIWVRPLVIAVSVDAGGEGAVA